MVRATGKLPTMKLLILLIIVVELSKISTYVCIYIPISSISVSIDLEEMCVKGAIFRRE